jgi:carbonic anhydrase
MQRITRRAVLRSGVIAGTGLMATTALGAGQAAADVYGTTTTLPPANGEEALARLLEGNRRYVKGQSVGEGRDLVRRVQEAQGQEPYAVIVSCADSRVPPEIIFDEGIGDLFVVRLAGNTAETSIIQGTIEYAVEYLHSVLLMVLGHEGCGAVDAALKTVRDQATFPGHISSFVDPILPAAQAVQNLPVDQQLDAAIAQNVLNQVGVLQTLGPILEPAISSGSVLLVGAEYLLKSGLVRVLT